jgi:hypothetical protein
MIAIRMWWNACLFTYPAPGTGINIGCMVFKSDIVGWKYCTAHSTFEKYMNGPIASYGHWDLSSSLTLFFRTFIWPTLLLLCSKSNQQPDFFINSVNCIMMFAAEINTIWNWTVVAKLFSMNYSSDKFVRFLVHFRLCGFRKGRQGQTFAGWGVSISIPTKVLLWWRYQVVYCLALFNFITDCVFSVSLIGIRITFICSLFPTLYMC